MISPELELSVGDAFAWAEQYRHEFTTVEHLLLGILNDQNARQVLRACSANIDELRKELSDFIKDNTPVMEGTDAVGTTPTLGFKRVLARAMEYVQSSHDSKRQVTGADVLLAIFGEKKFHAVSFLHKQNITRLDVVNFIAHGIRKDGPVYEPPIVDFYAFGSLTTIDVDQTGTQYVQKSGDRKVCIVHGMFSGFYVMYLDNLKNRVYFVKSWLQEGAEITTNMLKYAELDSPESPKASGIVCVKHYKEMPDFAKDLKKFEPFTFPEGF